MTKSRTFTTSGLPGIVKDHYHKTVIKGEGKTRSGVGKTAQESQKNASKNWEKANKK